MRQAGNLYKEHGVVTGGKPGRNALRYSEWGEVYRKVAQAFYLNGGRAPLERSSRRLRLGRGKSGTYLLAFLMTKSHDFGGWLP